MDSILQALLSWQFLFFCLAVGAVVFVIRILVEYGMENWWPLKQWQAANKDSKLWRSAILPILPILLGVTGAYFATGYPYPEGVTSTSARLAFGLVGGFTSSLIVRLYVAFLSSKVSEFRDKVNTMLNHRGPQDETQNIANRHAKEQVAEEKHVADEVLVDAKVVADEKLADAKVVADDKLSGQKEIAAEKVSNARDLKDILESDPGASVRDTINKDQ